MDGNLEHLPVFWIHFVVYGSGNPCRNDVLFQTCV